MYKIDLRNGFFAVPEMAVTLNGLHLPQLNRENAGYTGRVCLIMPIGTAAMGVDGCRPYVYENLAECRADKANLHSLLTVPTVKSVATPSASSHLTPFSVIVGLLKQITDTERLELFSAYCSGCGTELNGNTCHCRRDE